MRARLTYCKLPQAAAALLSVFCFLFCPAPASARVYDCNLNNKTITIDWGKIANLKKGLYGRATMDVPCTTDGGKSGMCVYFNNSDPYLGGYKDGNPRVPYTLYNGATNTPLPIKGDYAGPIIDLQDPGSGAGTIHPRQPIIFHADIGIKVPRQSGSIEEDKYGKLISLSIAVGTSDGFESNCRGWNGVENATWSDQFTVNTPILEADVNIMTYCSLDSVGTLDFGRFPLLNHDINADTNLTLDCSLGTEYTLSMGKGRYYKNGSRQMALGDGKNFVSYQLFQDSARSLPWGDRRGEVLKDTSNSLKPVQIPIYGRVPAQPTPAAGKYKDAVVVTVDYNKK